MKHLFAALSVLLLAGSAAHAEFNAPPPPSFGGGNFGHGGFVPPPPPPPGFGDRGDERDRDWRHGPQWGEHDHDGWHHGGPGFPGHGFPPPPPPPMGITQFIDCESHGYDLSYCPVSGFIMSAQVTNQRSFAACELGQSYGFRGNQLWVRGGCRATFAVVIRR